MSKPNVFSEHRNIVLLVHTQSYLVNDSTITYFQNAGRLPGIKILFMPLVNGSTDRVKTGKYVHIKDDKTVYTQLEFPGCSGLISTHAGLLSDGSCDTYVESYLLHGKCRTEMFNYIVAENQIQNDIFDCDVPVISFKECKEIIRLRMICWNELYIDEYTRIHEFTYYIYRHKCMFPAFQAFWEAAVRAGLNNWTESLDNRLDLMSRCFDQCKICAYKRIDNNTIMHIKYHLAYLLLLITGTFDNLAWIINDSYKLHADEKSNLNVDLKKQVFLDKVKLKSKLIYGILSDRLFKVRINTIRKMRDRIVHRDFLQAYRGGKARAKREICYLQIMKSDYDEIKSSGYEDNRSIIITGDVALIEMVSFINYLEEITIDMIDSLISIIAKEVYEREDTVVIWKLLYFPCEPYVL